MATKKKKEVVLSLDAPAVLHLCNVDKKLANLINQVGPLKYYKRDSSGAFEFLVHEIIEQMLSIKAGEKIFARLVSLCDGEVTPYVIDSLSFEQIKGIGTASSKAKYIKELAHAVINREIDFESLEDMSDEEAFNSLTKLNGIGTWTAKMYLIFVLGRDDILPHEDAAFLQTYKWMFPYARTDKKSIEKHAERWRPYRSIASRFMYRALDMGLTKKHRVE